MPASDREPPGRFFPAPPTMRLRERLSTAPTMRAVGEDGADEKQAVGALTIISGPDLGAVHALVDDVTIIGRGADAQVTFADGGLSRQHARIVREGGEYFVEDLASTNGTFLNGKRIFARQPLLDGARIHTGEATVLRFSLQDQQEQAAARRLYELSVRDALTGLYNRRYADERLHGELSFALRHRTTLTMLLMDADHFKQINDTHGHPVGDQVLRVLALELQRAVRAEDVVARYGGEEFFALARGIDVDGAMLLAERLRRTVENASVVTPKGPISFTVSIGVAHLGTEPIYPTVATMVAAADGALYAAKRGGRNRVAVADSGEHRQSRPADDTLKPGDPLE